MGGFQGAQYAICCVHRKPRPQNPGVPVQNQPKRAKHVPLLVDPVLGCFSTLFCPFVRQKSVGGQVSDLGVFQCVHCTPTKLAPRTGCLQCRINQNRTQICTTWDGRHDHCTHTTCTGWVRYRTVLCTPPDRYIQVRSGSPWFGHNQVIWPPPVVAGR